ncbi:MAG: glycosyltransferase family 2 protein [Thalassovita sp.]
MSSETKKTTYQNGFDGVVEQMGKRMAPIAYGEDESPIPLDIPLEPLKLERMHRDAPELGKSTSPYARKYRELAKEFHDRPALLHLHGLLIAHSRRVDQPAHFPALFCRLWEEESDFLLEHLDARWLVSAATTFGDHGVTSVQRQLGQALSVLFNMMKLYETERLYSGHPSDRPFSLSQRSDKGLAMQMDAFSLTGGGLDVNMLGRLWLQAEEDPVMQPLAQRLLTLLIEDDKTVFRRLRTMRARKLKKMKQSGTKSGAKRDWCVVDVPAHLLSSKETWSTVSLVKAPLRQIARFAAYHLDLGAQSVTLYLDAPKPGMAAFLRQNPRVTVVECDDAYWDQQKRSRMKSHQQRQVWVATQAYHQCKATWLAHIDVDEFLLPPDATPEGMQNMLSRVGDTMAGVKLLPAEMLADTKGDELFKLLPRLAQPPVPPENLYPNYGIALPRGFLSHTEGKHLMRTGLDGVRMGVHTSLHGGLGISNIDTSAGGYLGHAHAPDWQTFRAHLDFRTKRGSYRKADAEKLQLKDVLDFVIEENGEDGLRQFFDELCVATPRLTDVLDQHGLLLRRKLDLDAKVARHFGPLPNEHAGDLADG